MTRLNRFRSHLKSCASRDAICAGIQPIHILTLETIMLRVGLACGFIKATGGANGQQKAN